MIRFRLLVSGLVVGSLVAAGCGDKPQGKDHGHSHDHGDAKGKSIKVAEAGKDDHDHDHGEGPHGGTVLEFGKYHGEFCVDHDKKLVTVYILDGSAKKGAAIGVDKLSLSIKSPQFQIELKAAPQDGDAKGTSSRFEAKDDRFGKVQEFEGTVSGVIDGKPYLGDFKEESHTGHDHGKK
jgi:hypothetical protein